MNANIAARFNPQAKLAVHPRFREFIAGNAAGNAIAPINVEVSITHRCQATCGWCFYAGTHVTGPESLMPVEMAEALLADMRKIGCEAVTWTGGGEPALHSDLGRLVNRAADLGLRQGLFTNGLKMPVVQGNWLSWVRISYTNRPWDRDVIGSWRAAAPVVGLVINYVGADEPIHEALEIAGQQGLDYVQVRPALNLRGLVTSRALPQIEHPLLHCTQYKFDDSPNPHGYSRCYGYHFVPFVWHNGDVDVCGYHPGRGQGYTIGSLKTDSFEWIMQQRQQSVPVIPECQVCCKNHEVNKLINAALTLQDRSFV